MARSVSRLTPEHLASADDHVRSCLSWQLDPVARERVHPSAATDAVAAWVDRVTGEWGTCGRVVLVDDRPVGMALYGPAGYFPGALSLPTAPVTPDAVLLASVHVSPGHRGGGLGRMLVQGVARDLVERGCPALEAFGDPRGPAGRDCVMPVGFLEAVGFATQRAHATAPRMRMDLRTTRRWRSEVETALERLLGAVGPAPKRATRLGREPGRVG